MLRPLTRRWLIPLMLVVLALPACGNSTDDGADTTLAAATTPTTARSTSTTPASTSSTSDESDSNTVLAQDVIAAWSANDAEALWAHFTPDAVFADFPAHDSHTLAYAGFYMALHDTVTVSDCTASSSIPDRVTCRARGVDELSGPAGAASDGEWVFDFADGQVVALSIYDDDHSKVMFVEAMAAWIRDEHPDIWESVFIDSDCSPARVDCYASWAASPETASAMLQLGPEYRTSLDS